MSYQALTRAQNDCPNFLDGSAIAVAKVGALVEAVDTIGDRLARGEEQDGSRAAGHPGRVQHSETVTAWLP